MVPSSCFANQDPFPSVLSSAIRRPSFPAFLGPRHALFGRESSFRNYRNFLNVFPLFVVTGLSATVHLSSPAVRMEGMVTQMGTAPLARNHLALSLVIKTISGLAKPILAT